MELTSERRAAFPPPLDEVQAADPVFAGGGEMGALCRARDWSTTPLGPPAGWTKSLRTVVGALLNSRHPMFLFWGPQGVQLYNDAYRPSFGGGGRHPAALGALAREFWTDIWDVIGPQIEQVMTRGEATWHEDQYLPILRNGALEEVYWTYSYSPVMDDDGRVNGVLVVCQETTRRVLSERSLLRLNQELELERSRMGELLRHAPAVMALYAGPEHVVEYVNPAWERTVGKPGALGRPFREAFPEFAETGLFELLDRVYRSGEAYENSEVSVPLQRWPDAPVEDTHWHLVWQPLGPSGPLEPGATRDVLVHAVEVTAQVRARREVEALLVDSEQARRALAAAGDEMQRQAAELEAALRELRATARELEERTRAAELAAAAERAARAEADAARAEAETANQAKAQFLAVMSHELRTPLNAIGGYAELMEMGIHGPVTAAMREDLGRIQHSQRHLLGLINEVLNYAKLETGTVHYDFERVPVREALQAGESLVAPQARGKGIALRVVECPPGIAVRADVEKLRQVLANLLSNAVKFTEPGGRVEAACEVPDDDAADLRITVRDTGIGIPPEKLASIFEPFVQVRAELTRTQEGTGLGLAISRDLARGMGGELTAESTVGEGSTFTLTLPRA